MHFIIIIYMNTCLIFLYWVTHFSEVFKTRRWNDIDSFRQSQSPAMQLLVDQIPSFCLSSRAANTQRQYRYVFNAFCKWCLSINFSNTLPASVISVASYLVYLTNIGKSTSSINEAVYAISWAHRLAGVENPCKSDLVISVKEGSLRSVGHIVVKKEPITPEILYQIVMLYGNDKSNLKDVRIACMCLISFAGFLRYSELANLTRNNIVFHDSYISLLIESSKTDIYREGRDVLISKTDKITCPVKMLMKYLDLANIKSDSNDLIFRPLSFCKSVNGYKLRNGKLSYTTARDILLSTLTSIGLDKKYFGLHSLRSGGATAAANAHVEDRIFKKHGRWKSDRAKDGYVKENISERLTVTKNLGI
ncbi:integrase/recombinase xerD homolog [Mytilus edulis]|uniref:integrase/recombinase xerD homolog n=1 Tax=Mytilus edulis TaxID=6550 RepID=UPI0039F05806